MAAWPRSSIQKGRSFTLHKQYILKSVVCQYIILKFKDICILLLRQRLYQPIDGLKVFLLHLWQHILDCRQQVHRPAAGVSGLSCDAVHDIIAVVGNQGFQSIDKICVQHGLGNLKDMSEADFAPLGKRHAACRSQGQSRFSFNSRESFATYLPRLTAYAQQAKEVAIRAGSKMTLSSRFRPKLLRWKRLSGSRE